LKPFALEQIFIKKVHKRYGWIHLRRKYRTSKRCFWPNIE